MGSARTSEDFAQVETRSGRVRGLWRHGETGSPTAAFLGIPFAEPPVGDLRFAAPVPVAPWPGVRDALEYGATAQRGDHGGTLIPEPSIPGLGTLNVNVFTPRPGPDPSGEDGGLPVLVWIHGGGFVAGSPASPWYDGAAFGRDGIVTVTLSYRLGFDGFGLIEGAPTNRGVRDWLEGLRWVKANIAAFGGDPARVTIAGQSAGGAAVLTLLGMESAQDLFCGALAISAPSATLPREAAADYTTRLAKELGISGTAEAFREIPESEILSAQERVGSLSSLRDIRTTLGSGRLPLAPVIDGELISRTVEEALAAGVGSDKPLLLGAADGEVAGTFRKMDRLLRLLPLGLTFRVLGLDPTVLPAYRAANPEVAGEGHGAILGQYVTDAVFRSAVVRVADARGEAPTWVYRFVHPSSVHGVAIHCIDVPFWFDCLDDPAVERLTGPRPPQALADVVHGSACRLVRDGAPGWAAWSRSRGTARVFGTADGRGASSVQSGAFDGTLPLTDEATRG